MESYNTHFHVTLWFCNLSRLTGTAAAPSFFLQNTIASGGWCRGRVIPSSCTGMWVVWVCHWDSAVKTSHLTMPWHPWARVPLGYRPYSGMGRGSQYLLKANAYIGKESPVLLGPPRSNLSCKCGTCALPLWSSLRLLLILFFQSRVIFVVLYLSVCMHRSVWGGHIGGLNPSTVLPFLAPSPPGSPGPWWRQCEQKPPFTSVPCLSWVPARRDEQWWIVDKWLCLVFSDPEIDRMASVMLFDWWALFVTTAHSEA